MFRPILIPTIAHGITDIVDAPVQSILTYGIVCPLVYHFPFRVKAALLLCGSVYHMRHDMPDGLRGNILMHFIWMEYPLFAELCLSLIHTPRHYYRTLLQNSYGFKAKVICIFIMTLVAILEMHFKYTRHLVSLWWVGPVLSHIYMTDFYLNKFEDKRHIL